MANENKMNIIEALVKLRNDLKLWVANNLRVKLDKNLGEDNANKILSTDANGDIVTVDNNFLTEDYVTNNAPQLNWGATSTVGKIGDTELTVTMPTDPSIISHNFVQYGLSYSDENFPVGAPLIVNTETNRAHDSILHDANGVIECEVAVNSPYTFSIMCTDTNGNFKYCTEWFTENISFETDIPCFYINVKKNDETDFTKTDIANINKYIKVKTGVFGNASVKGNILPTYWAHGGYVLPEVGEIPTTQTDLRPRVRSFNYYPAQGNVSIEFLESTPTYYVSIIFADAEGRYIDDYEVDSNEWIMSNHTFTNIYASMYLNIKKADDSTFTAKEIYNINNNIKIRVTREDGLEEDVPSTDDSVSTGFIPEFITAFANPNDNAYNSWAKNLYDYENNRIITVYTSGPDHAYGNKDIWLAINKDGKITYSKIKEGGTAGLKALGIVKHNGTYIVLYTYADVDTNGDGKIMIDDVTKFYRMTSTDLVNWNTTDITTAFKLVGSATGYVNIDNMHLIEGRLFTTVTYYKHPYATIRYSDDDGLTWSGEDISFTTINGGAMTVNNCPCECVFTKVKDRLILLARQGTTGDRTSNLPLLFGYSTDNGVTWSNLVSTTGITDANNSNFSIARYGEDKVIVLFATRKQGTAGIYYSVTDVDDAYNGNFANQVKLNDGIPTSDFGCPNIVRTPNGFYYTYYTSGSASDSSQAEIQLYKLNYPTNVDKLNDVGNMLSDMFVQK